MANIVGTSGNDTLIGTANNDSIDGLAGNDVLQGRDGNDTLIGGAGDDGVYGEGGNDSLTGGLGNDYLDGGVGNDAYTFAVGAGVDHIQDYDTTAGNTDVVTFTGVASTALTGLERQGSGLVFKYGTSDQAIVDRYFDPNFPGYKVEQFKFSDAVTWDEAAIKARVITMGTTGGDGITGYNDGTNRIYGLDGNDSLIGGALADVIDGGNGNDVLQGRDGNDTLIGGAGDDGVYGEGGNDSLTGGLGNDYLDGGVGNDTASYSNATVGVTVTLSLTTAQNTIGAGTDRLLNLENLTGSNLNDNLKGNAGNNILNGRAGNDILNGDAGADTASYEGASAAVTVNLSLVTAQNTGGAGTDTLQNLENLTGSSFNDSLTGNSSNNVLSGGGGNDALNGGSGNDTLIGGLGLDTLTGSLGNDLFDYNAINESPVGTGRDKIVDFTGAGAVLGDQISLTDLDANSVVAGDQAFSYIGSAAFFAAGQLRYSGGILSGSTDADTVAEFEIQLVGTPALTVGGAGTDILL